MIDERDEIKRGMLWLGSATMVAKLLDIGATLVIFALLTAEEIGTAALVLSVGAVVESLSGMGLGHALIQAPNLTDSDEHSLFWQTTLIGLALALVIIVLAPVVSSGYGLPVLLPMMLVTSAKMVLVGAAVVPHALLSKHLKFKEAAAAQTIASMGEGLAKIGLAAAGFGAWALVGANAWRGVVLLVAVLRLERFRPRRHYSWAEVRKYQGFGVKIATSTVMYQGSKNADYFLVGKLLGVDVLGIYKIAFDVAMQPLDVILGIVNKVAYPIYAKISHDTDALRAALLRATRSVTLMGAPIVAFLFFAAGDVLALVTHERWGAAVPAVQLLVWGGLLRGAAHLFPQVYLAAGRPMYAIIDASLSLLALGAAFTAGLLLLPEWGVLSVCWAWIVVYPFLLQVHLVLTRRIMPLGTLEYLRALAPGVGAAALMVAVLGATLLLPVHRQSHLLSLGVWAALSAGTYMLYLRVVLKMRFGDLKPRKAEAHTTPDDS